MNWAKFLDDHAEAAGGLFLTLGFFMLMGTMGAFELDSIALWQVVFQSIMSIILIVVGAKLMKNHEKTVFM